VIEGGSIDHNTAGAAGVNGIGGGIRGSLGTDLWIKDGTIEYNSAIGTAPDGTASEGGGIHLSTDWPGWHNNFRFEGGSISNNSAVTGGGLYIVAGSGSTTNNALSGGTISANSAATGAGVYLNPESAYTFTMKDSIVIAPDNDVYLGSGKTITITGALSGAVPVAVITPAGYTAAAQVLDGAAFLAANHTKFAVTPPSGPTPSYWFVDFDGRLMTPLTTSSDLLVNFGIKPAGYTMNTITAADVEAGFNAVHIYLQSLSSPADLTGADSPVKLGDYIDLPSLSVAGYPTDAATAGYGKITNLSNAAIAPATLPFAGYEGAILRLIVVGRNSFNAQGTYSGNGNGTTAHVVFQFQNLPVSRRMNATDTNAGGYKESEMRKYLVPYGGSSGNFSTGLQNAGVPVNTDIIWAPKRYAANDGSGASAADLIDDKIWLPTERELFGTVSYSHETYETEANQARLEYYADNGKRIKYLPNNTDTQWWGASPWSTHTDSFCCAWTGGSASADLSSSKPSYGCAPAFCVR
jgi:hypothetical protein